MPTELQKKLVKGISDNLRNPDTKPMGELMRDAGYSESTSKAPTRTTQSKSFQEILKKAGITENKLAKRLNEGLDADKIVGTQKVSDVYARHRYLLTALELGGHIRQGDSGRAPTMVVIQYGYRNENIACSVRPKVEERSPQA